MKFLAKILGVTPQELGWKELEHSFGKLKDTLKPPLTTKEWDDWFAELRKKTDAAAKALATTMSPGGEGDSEADQKAEERRAQELARFQEHLAQKLTVLQESLMTERETELANYDQRLLDLEDFHARGMLSDQEYRDALARNKQQLADKLKQIDADIERNERNRARRVEDAYWNLAQSGAQALNALFGENKAVAIGMAAVDIAAGIAQAMRLPYPLNWIEAAARAAQGVASIAAIRSAKPGGGNAPPVRGAGGGSGAAAQAPAAAQSPAAGSGQTLYLSINGRSFDQETVRELASQLIEFQRDGGKVVLAPA